MMLLAEPAGRLLECTGNRVPRGMTVQDRIRLTGQLPFIPVPSMTFDPKPAGVLLHDWMFRPFRLTCACQHENNFSGKLSTPADAL